MAGGAAENEGAGPKREAMSSTPAPCSRLPASGHGLGSGEGVHSSSHTLWLPTVTKDTCLQMAPWEPMDLKLILVNFMKMKFEAEDHCIKDTHGGAP